MDVDECCPGCLKAVFVLPGHEPFQYDYKTKKVWHRVCLEEKEE